MTIGDRSYKTDWNLNYYSTIDETYRNESDLIGMIHAAENGILKH